MAKSYSSKRRSGKLVPHIERLEDRRLLIANNVIAQFQGNIATANAEHQIPISIASSDFTLSGARTILGFQIQPQAGSTLDPGTLKIRNSSGNVVPVRLEVPNLTNNSGCLVVAELGLGSYTISVAGQNNTSGGFELSVSMAGDVNGDRKVDLSDVTAVRNLLGVSVGNAAYQQEADANLDGMITSFDYTQARDNNNDSTRIRPLTNLSISVTPAPKVLSDGTLITNSSTVSVQGSTQPVLSVKLETSSDNRFDNGSTTSNSAGNYLFSAVPLQKGSNTIQVRARDGFGQQRISSLSLLVDTEVVSPTFGLATSSDTGIAGDHITSAGNVSLIGQTDPGATVTLFKAGVVISTSLADSQGEFQFAGVALASGDNVFTARALDQAGNVKEFSRTLKRVAPEAGSQDVIQRWSQVTLNAIRSTSTSPPVATRIMAMVATSIFDAVAAIDSTPGYLVNLPAPAGASSEAAAAAAAYRILSELIPAQLTTFDAALAASLAQVPAGTAKDSGQTFGQAVASAVIDLRKNDGATNSVVYTPSTESGRWQPTPPRFAVALLPQWADLVPFAMVDPNQFLPAPPPTLNSAEYATHFNDVKQKGTATGSTRTPDETAIALFWADGAGTITPPGHWNQIAMALAAGQGYGLTSNARLFAQLNVALADAAITSWNAKYEYDVWRPITAIRAAGLDGNDQTQAEADWTSLLVTPNFPTYTSGHSTFSGAAQTVLESFFGANTSFTALSEAPGIAARTFSSFAAAAEEAGRSRILGGIHFEFDNQAGLASGRNVGAYVLQKFALAAGTVLPGAGIQSASVQPVTTANSLVTTQGGKRSALTTASSIAAPLAFFAPQPPLTFQTQGSPNALTARAAKPLVQALSTSNNTRDSVLESRSGSRSAAGLGASATKIANDLKQTLKADAKATSPRDAYFAEFKSWRSDV